MTHNSDFTKNTHILLVDNDKELLASSARILRYFPYKVTTVETGSEAMALLSHETMIFDLVLIDAYLPDINGFTLLHHTTGKGILTIVTSNDRGNVAVAELALQYGAFLYLEKPLNIEVLKTVWQHMMKDRMMKARLTHGKEKINSFEATFGNTSENKAYYEKNRLENNKQTEIKEKANESVTWKSGKKRKGFTQWTEERHKKFVAAINQLGDDNCYPKNILELMNEPNLTRLQVASHLQKCRLGRWRVPRTSKNFIPKHPNIKVGVRKYGKKPILQVPSNISEPPQIPENHEAPEIYELPLMGSSSKQGEYLSGFGVDTDKSYLDEIPNINYQLPEMDDTLSFSKLLDREPFIPFGSVHESFSFGPNFNFSYQPQGGGGV